MTFRGSGRPSVSEGAGVGQHFHAAHRAASRTYIADVTSISLDGFIRFRSDRRSFTIQSSDYRDDTRKMNVYNGLRKTPIVATRAGGVRARHSQE